MSKNNVFIDKESPLVLGLLGLLALQTNFTTQKDFLTYLQRCSTDELFILLDTAALLVDKYRASKTVIWMFNDPFYELSILQTALTPSKNKQDTLDIGAKLEAFMYIKDFLEIHDDTFPYIQTECQSADTFLLENPASNTSIAQDIDQESRTRYLIAPALVLGASFLVALNSQKN